MKVFKTDREFENAINSFNNLVKTVYDPKILKGYPIFDGPLSIRDYYYSPVKIVWVLKECYDDGGESWDKPLNYSDLLGKYWSYEEFLSLPLKTTWHPIVYSSYGIFEDKLYDKIPYIKDDESIALCLKSIAIVNINKIDAKLRERTNMNELEGLFKDYGSIVLKEQLELLEPDIIIFGSTFEIVNKYLNLVGVGESLSMHNCSMTNPYKKDDILYLDCYHPAVRRSKEKYCNDIIQCFNQFSRRAK